MTGKAAPPVTIGMPIFNAEPYLADAVRSILNQTFSDFQVIAVLDGATDRSEEILRSLVDERFVVIKNSMNRGLRYTCNLMLADTTSPFFSRADCDDISLPDRIRKQFEYLTLHTDTDIVGAQYDYLTPQGDVTENSHRFPLTHDEIKSAFRMLNAMPNPVSMFRTERIRAMGGFEVDFAEDLTLWLKCLANGYRFANLPDVLLHYRRHAIQLMSRKLEPTLLNTDRAYATYGRAIWGEQAPDYVSGYTPWHRLRRRAARILRRIIQKEPLPI